MKDRFLEEIKMAFKAENILDFRHDLYHNFIWIEFYLRLDKSTF